MSMNLRKVAAVLDAAASYVDCVEREKLAAIASERQGRVDKVASAHAAAHGEEIPDDIRQKLAATDPSVLSYVENVLAKNAGVVDTLGAPASLADDDPPVNIKEAADAADKKFLSWILQ